MVDAAFCDALNRTDARLRAEGCERNPMLAAAPENWRELHRIAGLGNLASGAMKAREAGNLQEALRQVEEAGCLLADWHAELRARLEAGR